MQIDTAFDFRSDSRGRDPDICSPTLRRYHRLLWSKPLPDGTLFTLEDLRSHGYLLYRSEREEIRMSSDTVLRTFSNHKKMQHIMTQVPDAEREDALRRGYTIGGMILFPGAKVEGKHTINQARGINAKLEDRFDLTLECIRRHYTGSASPLSQTLARYERFFTLFGDFRGYVDFFLLQDLAADDYSSVRFWSAFDDFITSPLPRDIDSYRRYRTKMIGWIEARNQRIAMSCH